MHDRAVKFVDRLERGGVILVQEFEQFIWIQFLGNAGESGDVTEENTDFLIVAARFQQGFVAEYLIHPAGRDVRRDRLHQELLVHIEAR
jgi:hypothetical protein